MNPSPTTLHRPRLPALRLVIWVWVTLAGILIHTACSPVKTVAPPPASEPAASIRPTSTATIPAAAEPPSTPLAAPRSRILWLDPALPEFVTRSMALPAGWQTGAQGAAVVRVVFGDENPAAQWILALAAPFPSLLDDVSSDNLLSAWRGNPTDGLSGRGLLVSQAVYDALTIAWGPALHPSLQVLDAEDLLTAAWDTGALAILPFEDLEPRWKVITVDGQSPIRADFDAARYALAFSIGLQGDPADVDQLNADVQSSGQRLMTISNRDATKLTVLAMTGVTALARSTAYTMLEKGITYPGENVREVLASADITHISNEVAFAGNCPEPLPQRTGMMFCSDPSYIELLEYIGTDLIELTGDHLADWGQKAIYLTLDMYAEEGWPVYGGGVTLQEGQQPVIIEHNGNRLAFLGCNAKGAAFATATDDAPGAVPCDFALLRGQIEQLVSDGYLPIVSIQHNEYDLYEAQEIQIRDFRRLAESGAVIVSGSQSHRPQGMEFYENAFLHYGLGNLFFDQYSVGKPFRQGTIDRHVFYNNRHISTELIPTALIDFAQPRILSGQERDELLEILFTVSGWEIRSRDQE